MSDVNTRVLLHFNSDNASVNIDDFGSLKVWTAGGTAVLNVSTKKFGRASLWLDGDTGYISTPDHADFTLGSAGFTFDFWVKFPVLPGTNPQTFFCKYQDGSNRYYMDIYDNVGVQTIRFRSISGGIVVNNFSFALTSLTAETWTHFELVRSVSNIIYLFQDGTLVDSHTGFTEISDITGAFEIGRNSTGYYLNAWIDEFRFSVVARNVVDFTPMNVGYKNVEVDDEYTSLLAHFSVPGVIPFSESVGLVYDSSAGTKPIPSIAQYKWAPSSLYMAGSGYGGTATPPTRVLPWHRQYATIDCWIRFVSFASIVGIMSFGASGGVDITYNGTGVNKKFSINSTDLILPSALVVDTWYHLAFVKNAGTTTLYIDGTSAGTFDTATACTPMDTLAEAKACNYLRYGGIFNAYNGVFYLDELRISVDIQRWTENFIAPTEAYGAPLKYEVIADGFGLGIVTSEKHADTFADGFGISQIVSELYPDTLAETIDMAEMQAFIWEKLLDESIGIVDEHYFEWRTGVIEALSIADTTVYARVTLLLTLTDIIFIWDALIHGWSVSTSEILTIVDSLANTWGINAEDFIFLIDSESNNWVGQEIVPDGFIVFDLNELSQIFQNVINESLVVTDSNTYALMLSVLEFIGFDELVSSINHCVEMNNSSLVIADSPYYGFTNSVESILSVIDSNTVGMLFLRSISEALGIADTNTLNRTTFVSASDSILFIETISNLGHFYSALYDTLALNVDIILSGEVWQCYVLSTPSFHPSMYSGFDFNSYCVFDNRAYAANDTGIFELTGDTDAGSTIHTGTILSQTDFGAPNQKRFRKGYLGITGDSPVMVFEAENGEREAFTIDEYGRVVGSHDLKSKKWVLSIADYDTLDHIKLIPIILTK